MDAALLGPGVAIASGVLLALLGLGLFVVARRTASTVAFATFSTTWGIMVVLGNASRVVSDPVLERRLTLLFLAAYVIVYAPLAYFVSLYPRRRGPFAGTTMGGLVLLAPAGIAAVALLFAPSLLYEGGEWGPLVPFYDVLFAASFIGAVLALARERRRGRGTIDGKRAELVLFAFTLFLAFDSVENVILYLPSVAADPAASLTRVGDLVFVLDSLAGCVAVGYVALQLLREQAPTARRAALLAIALPALFGAASGVTLGSDAIPDVETIGLFRAASVVLIAYAILRFELFDVEVKLKRGALAAAVLIVAGLAALLVEQALERVLGSTGLAITVTQLALLGAVAAVVLRSPSVARALGKRVLPSLQSPERLDARRLEVYEAALAQAATSGGIPANAEFLRDLRARLGISESEHALLARLIERAPPTADAPLDAGVLVAGRYRLERLLGEGAAAGAWLAVDETLARRAVLKVAHASLARSDAAARAFLHEARVAASLDHPNVVRVFDFGHHGDVPFLVMELVEGGTLEDRLARGPLPAAEARAVVGDVLRGLAHVHAHGVLHRDLKPANVLLTPEGVAKIGDFGVALAQGVEDTVTGLAPPLPKGTLSTMSPEVVRGLPATPASDVYAVGALLYRCLTGQHYVRLEGRSREAARAAVLTEPPLPPGEGVDPALLRAALRALGKDPSSRYATAEEMLVALGTLVIAR